MYPTFRKQTDGKDKGKAAVNDSMLARKVVNPHRGTKPPPADTPDSVRRNALSKVTLRGGNLNDEKDVLGEYIFQRGRYRYQTFRWILENTPGYAGWIAAEGILKEGSSDTPLSVETINQRRNRNSLTDYLQMFKEGREILAFKMIEVKERIQQRRLKEFKESSTSEAVPSAQPSPMSSRPKHYVIQTVSPLQMMTPIPKPVLKKTQLRGNSAKDTPIALGGGFPPVQKSSSAHTLTRAVDDRLLSSNSTPSGPRVSSSHSEAKDTPIALGGGFPPANDTPIALGGGFPPVQKSSSAHSLIRRAVDDRLLSSNSTPSGPRVSSSHSEAKDTPIALGGGFPPANDTPIALGGGFPPVQKSSSAHSLIRRAVDDRLLSSNSTPSGPRVSSSHSEELLLLEGWKSTLPKEDQKWISRQFCGLSAKNTVEFKTERVKHLWNDPPQLNLATPNSMERYFHHRLFLWMPVNFWQVRLTCPHVDAGNRCNGTMTRCGMHQKTRRVLTLSTFYNIASEYLRCSKCGKKMIAWAHNLISQLDPDRQLNFPCILTSKYACDKTVVCLLRHRGLGNSSSMVARQLQESHGQEYLTQVHHYLTACKSLKARAQNSLINMPQSFKQPPAMIEVPQYKWLMKIYQIDVLQRLDFIKASMTSLFGSVLKMDSTKKITKKLGGKSAKTAMWATNIGNEHGQVIMSVMTTSEGKGLQQMILGLCRRYSLANVPAPNILYVDRDCCGGSSIKIYFGSWPFLIVRLDIWHFMRRLSMGCTTDCHPLYGPFMRRLSWCIFVWDEGDVNLLKMAKRAELVSQHIQDPSDKLVMESITSAERSLHCRRMTRGTNETITLISQLIDSMDGDLGLDILGVPLFNSNKMRQIWQEQSVHVACFQDPAGVQLYTQLGTMQKGGYELPKFRCARGSTSLESFHLHMARFIPGTLANDINFQVYVVDGIHRWNEDRKQAALGTTAGPLCYDGFIKESVNRLGLELFSQNICPQFSLPDKYTGELIGIEYLYSQSSGDQPDYITSIAEMEESEEMPTEDEANIDEGFTDGDGPEDLTVPDLSSPCEDTPIALGGSCTASGPNLLPDDSDIGPDDVPGYRSVLDLAQFLTTLGSQTSPLSTVQAVQIIELWSNLSKYDQKRTKFAERVSGNPGTGRFCNRKKLVAFGVASIERAIIGPNSRRSSWPNCNRYVEAVCTQLLKMHPSDRRHSSERRTRWSIIMECYGNIQNLVNANRRVMEQTNIMLPCLNTKTLQQWFNEKGKQRDTAILLQGIAPPVVPMAGGSAPAPRQRPISLNTGDAEPFQFVYHPDTAGMAKLKVPSVPATSTATVFRPILPMPVGPLYYTQKRKAGEDTSNIRKKVTVIYCKYCGADRSTAPHKQYMGNRYCGTINTTPFEVWRHELQAARVARKEKNKDAL